MAIHKMGELVGIQQAAVMLANTKLPATAAYRISKNMRLLEQAVKPANAAHQDAVRKYSNGIADETTGQLKVLPENEEAFQAEMKALTESEVEVAFMLVSISELGNATVQPAVLEALDGFMITE